MKCNLCNSLLVAALVAAAGVTQARAVTLSDNFTVTATVDGSCSMVAGDIAFVDWDPLSSDAVSAGTISVTCSSFLPYSVAVDQGSNYTSFDCTTPTRRMGDGFGSYLDYGLYRDGGMGQPWGCDASSDHDGQGSGGVEELAVFARITNSQSITPGAYWDSLVATITF